ncbi:protein TonB, links inner and outer membranes [Tenacibaculum sp. MAR_2009_124]|uniref:energy transducer TonB family protein n=1 Tax=Tenacibaculum sp. MAR_2009_124 TaxID=1250059 RepID=UPI000896DC2A|nr:energy transducer TonB [Tenacibaculum sp. MAR_2009_124]SEB69087.1 protein TonB, links inner and outer membranes [Tenacibaculum sp. MAR_2009_124]
MPILETKHKKKSAVITIIILLLLLYGVFNFGMQYLDPPIEYGVAINFGNSDVGRGEPVEKTKQQATKETVEEVQEEQVEEVKDDVIKEDVITDDTSEDVPVIEKSKEEKKEVTETPEKTKPKEKPKPKPSKATSDALNSLLNGASKDGASGGEGDDDKDGTKGNQNGDPNSSKYYGKGGSGSGGNYNLAGRRALSKPVEKPNCQEEGTVVVSIEVDKNGKVIRAIPGVRGTTNSASCLYDAARKAALKTKWNPDSKAPTKQKGTIIYQFSLSQ